MSKRKRNGSRDRQEARAASANASGHNAAARDEDVREVRVFISSTFHDLHMEREHLIKKVFPELRLAIRERGVELTEIDLRWGVTEAEAKQGKVIRICLEEIERCRPFFIAILGERPGWIPSLQDVSRDAEIARDHPWILAAVAGGGSVTEIEILHGVLNDPTKARHAFFYLRDPAMSPDAPRSREASEAARKRLSALKDTIRRCGLPVREFADPSTLGQQVIEDLRGVIDGLYPPDRVPTPLGRERSAQEAFALTRRRAYLERPDEVRRLDEHVAVAGPPLVVVGESGAGKSALLAHWCARSRRANPNMFLIAYSFGASSSPDDDHLGLVRRVVMEIGERYGWEANLPASPEDIEEVFPHWLNRVRGERLVLVIDALDQLDGRSADIAWLPSVLTPQIRFILSTSGGRSLEALRRRGGPELVVRPLDLAARESIINAYLAQFRKTLSDDQRRRIAVQPACGNPLFLRTLLEELRVFGHHEGLDGRIAEYLVAPDLDDLFRRVLERMEGDYGGDRMREVLSLIWASRRGLSETELLETSGVSRLDLSSLLAAFDYHLTRREGRLVFFHDYLRRSVQARYLPGTTSQATAHRRLADYFEAQGSDLELAPDDTPRMTRRADELPWQLQRAGEWTRLKDRVLNYQTFAALTIGGREYELMGYWLALKKHFPKYFGSLEHMATLDPLAEAGGAVLFHFFLRNLKMLMSCAFYKNMDMFLALAEVGCPKHSGPDDSHTIALCDIRTSFLCIKGDYDGAEAEARRAVAIVERVHGVGHSKTASALNLLAVVQQARGNTADALAIARRVLAIVEESGCPKDLDNATYFGNLGTLLREKGDYLGAGPFLSRALEMSESLRGRNHPETADCLNGLGLLLADLGDHERAAPLFRRALEIDEAVFGPEHPKTATTLNNLASSLQKDGQLVEAEPLLRRSLAIIEATHGPDTPLTASGLNNLAGLLGERGRDAEAESLFRRALAIHEQVQGASHPDTARTQHNLAGLLRKQLNLAGLLRGNDRAALQLERSALATFERTLGPEHPRAVECLESLASLLNSRGDREEAARLYRKALAIKTKVYGQEDLKTAETTEALALVLHGMGDDELWYDGEATNRHRRLTPRNPPAYPIRLVYDGEATDRYRTALEIRRKKSGEEELELAPGLDQLALMLLTTAGRLAKRNTRLGGWDKLADCGVVSWPVGSDGLTQIERFKPKAVPDAMRSDDCGFFLYQELQKRMRHGSSFESRAPTPKSQLRKIDERRFPLSTFNDFWVSNDIGLLGQFAEIYAEVESLYRRALAIRTKQLGARHADTDCTRKLLQSLLKVTGGLVQVTPSSAASAVKPARVNPPVISQKVKRDYFEVFEGATPWVVLAFFVFWILYILYTMLASPAPGP